MGAQDGLWTRAAIFKTQFKLYFAGFLNQVKSLKYGQNVAFIESFPPSRCIDTIGQQTMPFDIGYVNSTIESQWINGL